jgi:hypothetical protein
VERLGQGDLAVRLYTKTAKNKKEDFPQMNTDQHRFTDVDSFICIDRCSSVENPLHHSFLWSDLELRPFDKVDANRVGQLGFMPDHNINRPRIEAGRNRDIDLRQTGVLRIA